jgi:hypothetical protein
LAGHVSTQLVRGLDGADAGFARASELGKQLERTQPELYARPELRFPLAAAHRKLGYQSQAARYFLSVRRSRPEDAWLANAQGERWLMERTGVSPKPLCVALSVKSKPHLDGMLDDACWRGATAIELTSPQEDDADWPAWAKLAYDQKFLYLAVHCGKARFGPAIPIYRSTIGSTCCWTSTGTMRRTIDSRSIIVDLPPRVAGAIRLGTPIGMSPEAAMRRIGPPKRRSPWPNSPANRPRPATFGRWACSVRRPERAFSPGVVQPASKLHPPGLGI